MKIKIIFSILLISLVISVFGQNNTVIDSLEQVILTANEDTVKVNSLNSLCSQYSYISNFKNAMRNAESALVLADKLKYKKGKANAYHAIGSINDDKSNYPEALENYFASLKIREEIGDKNGIADSYNNIGVTYKSLENYKEALENYFASLKIREEIGDKSAIADSYTNIGIIYFRQGNYSEVLEKFLDALKIKEEIGDNYGAAGSYNNIGMIYEKQGNYPEALKNYFACLKIAEETGLKYGIAGSYFNIGMIYIKLGNYPEALENHFASLKIREEIGDKIGISASYRKIAMIYTKQDNFEQALEYYKLHTAYKDSIFNEKNNKLISQLEIQYETEKKDREIQLLNKENEIKGLLLNQQNVSLLNSRLQAEKNQSNLLLMVNNREIQELKLAEIQKELDQQQAETKVKAAEMELLNKDKELQGQQLEKQKLLRNGMISGTFLLFLLGLLLFNSFKLRKKLEKQQAITQERKRISADLHDDVGSGLSRIMLLSEMVKKVAKTPETRKEAEKISSISQNLSSNISEIIWALNSNNDYVENMVAYIRRYAAEYFDNAPVKLKITTPDNISDRPISSENRRNIFFTVKEALHNIIKHAEATNAELNFSLKKDILSVVIYDNGIGMPKGELKRFGNGISNMKNRMRSINGKLIFENYQGTKITLSLPV